MFSYRHAFHAGNHADALKHLTLLACAQHAMKKDTPLLLIDTHAGVGLYELKGAEAVRSGEAARGIQRLQALYGQAGLPAALAAYLDVVASFNPGAARRGRAWRSYPGSPQLLLSLIDGPQRRAAHDRLKLFELHPVDATYLEWGMALWSKAGRRVQVQRSDGFDALKALLPPTGAKGGPRRALVLMDPSYEIKSDYARVTDAIKDALRRFASGVYLIWHPIVARREAHELPRRLRTLAQQAGRGWLHATLHTGAAASGAPGGGLASSGMFVINPPHTLAAALREALPPMCAALAEDATRAHWRVECGEGK